MGRPNPALVGLLKPREDGGHQGMPVDTIPSRWVLHVEINVHAPRLAHRLFSCVRMIFFGQGVREQQSSSAEGQGIREIVQLVADVRRMGNQGRQVNEKHQKKNHHAQT